MIWAPWTDEEVVALNANQVSGAIHPYTCLRSHPDGTRVLKATADGWMCEHCDYIQKWY